MFLTRLYVGAYTRIRFFLKNEEGASAIEYVLVATMVAVAIIAFVPTVGTAVTGVLTKIQDALTT